MRTRFVTRQYCAYADEQPQRNSQVSEVLTPERKDQRVKARSRSADVYAMLRSDILSGRLDPDARMTMDDLKRAYDVGLSPLREALMKLTVEGLVVLEEMKGFRVAPVSMDDLLDITRMRKELEVLGVRLSMENGGSDWEAGIMASLHRLLSAKKINDDGSIDPRWDQLHKEFHRSLVCACNSEWLQRFLDILYDQSDRYRKLSVRYLQMPRDDVSEHRQLAEAVLDHDLDKASALIRGHFDRTVEIIMEAKPDYYKAS